MNDLKSPLQTRTTEKQFLRSVYLLISGFGRATSFLFQLGTRPTRRKKKSKKVFWRKTLNYLWPPSPPSNLSSHAASTKSDHTVSDLRRLHQHVLISLFSHLTPIRSHRHRHPMISDSLIALSNQAAAPNRYWSLYSLHNFLSSLSGDLLCVCYCCVLVNLVICCCYVLWFFEGCGWFVGFVVCWWFLL